MKIRIEILESSSRAFPLVLRMLNTIKSYRIIKEGVVRKKMYQYRGKNDKTITKFKQQKAWNIHCVEFTEDDFKEFYALYSKIWHWKTVAFYIGGRIAYSFETFEHLRNAYFKKNPAAQRGDAKAVIQNPAVAEQKILTDKLVRSIDIENS